MNADDDILSELKATTLELKGFVKEQKDINHSLDESLRESRAEGRETSKALASMLEGHAEELRDHKRLLREMDASKASHERTMKQLDRNMVLHERFLREHHRAILELRERLP